MSYILCDYFHYKITYGTFYQCMLLTFIMYDDNYYLDLFMLIHNIHLGSNYNHVYNLIAYPYDMGLRSKV
jgi:hypothetical protein